MFNAKFYLETNTNQKTVVLKYTLRISNVYHRKGNIKNTLNIYANLNAFLIKKILEMLIKANCICQEIAFISFSITSASPFCVDDAQEQ